MHGSSYLRGVGFRGGPRRQEGKRAGRWSPTHLRAAANCSAPPFASRRYPCCPKAAPASLACFVSFINDGVIDSHARTAALPACTRQKRRNETVSVGREYSFRGKARSNPKSKLEPYRTLTEETCASC
jgi:hypothetical protein